MNSGVSDGAALLAGIWRDNGNGAFTNSGMNLPGMDLGFAAWGDYDNDGDLDVILVGYEGPRQTNVSRLYRNGTGSFVESGSTFHKLPLESKMSELEKRYRELSEAVGNGVEAVKRFDPCTDQTPQGKGVINTKIRTKGDLVNMSLFASDLIPEDYEISEKSSDFDRKWLQRQGSNLQPAG